MPNFKPAIGIDLGTTYSCVAIYKEGKVEIIPDNETGHRTMPSYVAFGEGGRVIGSLAKSQADSNPRNTIFDAKRMIGRKFEDPTLEKDRAHWPFEVIEENRRLKVQVDYMGQTKNFTPEEISAMVLSKMKEIAEAYLGCTVTDAVITVPAYFNDSQRQATKDAGTIAGLNVLRIINEPTAAALAYGLDKISTSFERNVLVFDLGGGTFDVSILSFIDGVFEVKATSGDTHLGGEDFDNLLVKHFLDEYQKENEDDLSENSNVLRILKSKCEELKRELSELSKTAAKLDIDEDSIRLNSTISRAKFEELCGPLFKSVLVPVQKALNDANMDASAIHDIVLVGGSTQIPKIEELLKDFFGPNKTLNKSINPDEAVAYGAAVQAAILSGGDDKNIKEVVLLDVIPMSIGIQVAEGKMEVLIKRNTLVPAMETKHFSTASEKQRSVWVRVYEGESMLVDQNNLLGSFRLNIPPLDGVKAVIALTCEIDTDGILKVSAIETNTGNENHIVIENDKGRLSKAEINQMIQDLKVYQEYDTKQREKIAMKVALGELIEQVQAFFAGNLIGNGDFSNEIETIENALDDTATWLKKFPDASLEEIKAKKNELGEKAMPIIRKLHESIAKITGELNNLNFADSSATDSSKFKIEDVDIEYIKQNYPEVALEN